MQRNFLVIPVDGSFSVHLKTPFALTLRTAIRSKFSLLILHKRPKHGTAGHAVKPADLQLRKHAAATRDYTADVDELVQVLVADVADVAGMGARGQSLDSNVNLLGDAFTAEE